MQVNRMAVLESSLMLSVVSAFADGRRQTRDDKLFEAFKTGEHGLISRRGEEEKEMSRIGCVSDDAVLQLKCSVWFAVSLA